MNSSDRASCDGCGAPLPAGMGGGLCPRCLLAVGLESADSNRETVVREGQTPLEQIGDTIDRYKLLQQIGEGGFGVVYLAGQTEPVKRKVALKVIKPGMDSKEVIARFEAERQALALMDHPNIAKVHDAGTTAHGRPYFVMELIKGVPITTYCDAQNLDIRARLELFTDVCAAVQHAHQKGVIHRDLKPSNILVSPHDGKPVVKVIDFGIAKAIGMELTEKTVFTAMGRMIGTPQYMSPEQAELNALDVDTRSDIYSLGVVLYELLTGTTPLDGEKLRSAGYAEMQRLIREEETPKPSTKISTLGTLQEIVATRRRVTPEKLTRLLRGEIDCVALNALSHDRRRRYQTSLEFAADIDRILNLQPISAKLPSGAYRLKMFVIRHRRLLCAAAALFLSLLIGLGVSTSMYFQAITARQAEKAARMKSEDSLYFAHIISARREWEDNRIEKFRRLVGMQLAEGSDSNRRGWEWYYLNSLLHSSDASFGYYGPAVTALALSPDGNVISAGYEDGNVLVFDANAERAIVRFSGHEGKITAISWDSRGERLVSAGTDGKICLWQFAGESRFLRRISHSSPVNGVVWAHDNLSFISGDQNGFIYRWEPETGNATRSWNSGPPIMSIDMSPDGRFLASSHFHSNGLVQTWSSINDKLIGSFHAGTGYAPCVKWAPNSRWLAASSKHGSIALWDQEAQSLISQRIMGEFPATALAWSSDARKLAVGGGDQAVRFVDIASYQASTPRCIHDGSISALAWASDGSRLFSGGTDGVIRRSDGSRQSESFPQIELPNWISTVAWDPTGARLAVAYFAGSFQIWNLGGRGKASTFPLHSAKIWSLAWHPSGNRIASISADGELVVSDPEDGEEIKRVKLPFASGEPDLAWSPNGAWIASADGGSAVVLDADSLLSLIHLSNKIRTLAWSRAGDLLATGADDGRVEIWRGSPDGFTLDLAIPAPKSNPAPVNALAWGPDSSRIAIADEKGRLRLSIIATQSNHEFTPAHDTGWIRGIAWSPQGDRIATCGQDGSVRIMNITDGEEILILREHSREVFAIDWSPDGRKIASGSFDGTVKIWDASRGYSRDLREPLRLRLEEVPNIASEAPDGGEYLPVIAAACEAWGDMLFEQNDQTTANDLYALATALRAPGQNETLAGYPEQIQARLDECGAAIRQLGMPWNGLGSENLTKGKDRFPDGFQTQHSERSEPEISPTYLAGIADILSAASSPVSNLLDALIATSRGDSDSAHVSTDLAFRLAPSSPFFARCAAKLAERNGNIGQAVDYLTTSIQEAAKKFEPPPKNRLLLERARLYALLGNEAAATADRLAALGIATRPADAPSGMIDLSSYYNASPDEPSWYSTYIGNNLSELPHGIQQLGGIDFDLRGIIQLRSTSELVAEHDSDFPDEILGIRIDRRCRKIHFLFAAQYVFDSEGTEVGSYVLHLINEESMSLPLELGENIWDWWEPDPSDRDPRRKNAIAWRGSNPYRRQKGAPGVALFKWTWTNPSPEVQIKSIDFVSKRMQSAPFLVAVSVE